MTNNFLCPQTFAFCQDTDLRQLHISEKFANCQETELQITCYLDNMSRLQVICNLVFCDFAKFLRNVLPYVDISTGCKILTRKQVICKTVTQQFAQFCQEIKLFVTPYLICKLFLEVDLT